MSGLAKRQMEFRAMLIRMTQNISMRHWNMFMVLSHLGPNHSSVQMEPSSSLIKIKSWRDGANISELFSTILHQSIMRQFSAFHKFQSIMNSMHLPLLVKLKRPLGSYQMARHLGLMLYSWSLQIWRTCTAPEAGWYLPVLMAARYCTARLQGHTYHSSLQEIRELSTMWQSPQHITPVHNW